MPTAIIADDEPHLIEYLRERLARLWPELQIVAEAGSGPDALAAASARVPDIAFLDIRMPGSTGLQVARELQSLPQRPRIVFVTAYDQYAVDAFDADAIDYLLKPVNDARLAQTIDRLKRALAAREPPPELSRLLDALGSRLPAAPAGGYLRWIRAGKRSADGEVTEQIAVGDVMYFQADDKYTCVIARRGREVREWLIRVPLSDLAAQLNPDQFQQIHRSVIVNMNEVAGTRRDPAGKLYVRIRDQERELPVARPYAGLFRQM